MRIFRFNCPCANVTASGNFDASGFTQIVDGLKSIAVDIEQVNSWSWLLKMYMNIGTDRAYWNRGKNFMPGALEMTKRRRIRLWLRAQIDTIKPIISNLQEQIIGLAIAESGTIIPGLPFANSATCHLWSSSSGME